MSLTRAPGHTTTSSPAVARAPTQRVAGFVLATVLLATPLRAWLESSMTAHMLVHIPLLLVAGVLLGAHRASHGPRLLHAWNPGGVSGLLISAAVLTTWMIPRALDLAALEPTVSWFKGATLLTAGGMLRASWPSAGAIGQAFFVGNLTWMGAVVGLLLRDAPVRVCTTYLERDQVYAGTGLLLLATAVGVRWFAVWLGAPTAATADDHDLADTSRQAKRPPVST